MKSLEKSIIMHKKGTHLLKKSSKIMTTPATQKSPTYTIIETIKKMISEKYKFQIKFTLTITKQITLNGGAE